MKRNTSSWLALSLWIALIFVLIPRVRTLTNWVESHVGGSIFLILTAILICMGAWAAWRWIVQIGGQIRPSSIPWLGAVFGAGVLWTQRLQAPVEAVHFVEYSVLGVLLYNALRQHIDDSTIFFVAALVGSIVGCCDELYQWATPERTFDFRDIFLNAGASIMSQLVLAKGFNAPESQRSIRATSLRVLIATSLVQILVISAMLSATPRRLEGLAADHPWLAHIIDQGDVITEYGHQFDIPKIGRFKSRFTIAELHRIDSARSVQNARILGAYHRHRDYRAFLSAYPSGKAPFVHEARVHLNSRVVNYSKALKSTNDPQEFRHRMTAAYREHLILETFFGHTMSQIPGYTRPKLWAKLATANDPDLKYESLVSAHLITCFNQRQALWALGVFSAILLAIYARVSWRSTTR